MKKNVALLTFLVLVLSCQDRASESAAYAESVDTAAAAASVADMVMPPPAAKKMDSNTPKDSKIVDVKIIKNADFRFETADLDKTYQNLAENVKKTNAIIQSDSEFKNDYNVSRNLTIRIPSQNFDAFVAELSKGVTYFDRKEISSRDVTAEYIDADARVASKKKLEIRYLELLKKANKVEEMLEIEKQLSAIREEIEAKEGQLKYVQNQVSMSTINIEFYKNMAAESGVRVSFFSKFWNAIVSGFNSIGVFLLYVLEMWPAVFAIVGLVIFIRKRRANRRNNIKL